MATKTTGGRLNPLREMAKQPGMAEEIERLRAMSMPELIDEHQRLWGKPPRVKNKGYVLKRNARKIQEIRFGGLSVRARVRLEELIAMLDIDFAAPAKATRIRTPAAEGPAVGTTLVRDYKGERIVVRVHADGFEWDGRIFPSLSAAAKSISGAHCSGRAFFGLNRRRAE